jgi:hypothetical protein
MPKLWSRNTPLPLLFLVISMMKRLLKTWLPNTILSSGNDSTWCTKDNSGRILTNVTLSYYSLIPYIYHALVIKAAVKHKKNVVTTSYVSPAMMEYDQA